MPTGTRTTSTPLTPQQTLEKVAGLITEVGEDTPATPEPAPPAATAAPEPVPPATPPPADAEPEPAPEDETDETPYQVTVDGAPHEVTLAELKRSYSSAAHNTQRAQELAEKEKRLEPDIRARVEQDVAQLRQQYLAGVAQVRAALQELQGEPDWVTLRTELEPGEFLKRKADWEAQKAHLEKLKQHEQQLVEEAQQAQAKQHVAYLRSEEEKLVAAIPEWGKDVAKGKAEIAKLGQFVQTKYGIPEAQVASAFQTASAILLARDAYRYAELHREPTAPTRAKVAPIKTASPGTVDRPRPNAKRDALVTQAAKTGRHRDAAKAIEDMLTD